MANTTQKELFPTSNDAKSGMFKGPCEKFAHPLQKIKYDDFLAKGVWSYSQELMVSCDPDGEGSCDRTMRYAR